VQGSDWVICSLGGGDGRQDCIQLQVIVTQKNWLQGGHLLVTFVEVSP
jgi:hypothetical protein